MTSRLLQVKEIAAMLSLSPQTVIRYSRSGKLPAPHKLPGGALRFPEAEVEAALEGWRERPALVPVREEGE